MTVLAAVLAGVCILLLYLLYSIGSELDFLNRQLEQLALGSHIELTSRSGMKAIGRMCRRLNHIFADWQKKELEYRRSRNELKQAVSGIAHDIRTPLTSAGGYLQMLRECDSGEKRLRYEGIIARRMEELKEMLEELFLFTKLSSDDYRPELRRTALLPALGESLASMSRILEERGIEPQVDFEKEDLYVTASPEALERIFRNLLNNAVLHGAGGLSITQRGNGIAFSNLVDAGGQLDVSRLFDRFYKTDKTRSKGSSGLGLAIVKELMGQMEGDVRAELEGDWLTVRLSFRGAEDGERVGGVIRRCGAAPDDLKAEDGERGGGVMESASTANRSLCGADEGESGKRGAAEENGRGEGCLRRRRTSGRSGKF